MKTEIVYFIKRLFIVALAVTLAAGIEAAPDHPVWFAVFALAGAVSIRALWLSACRDEKKLRRRRLRRRPAGVEPLRSLKRAA